MKKNFEKIIKLSLMLFVFGVLFFSNLNTAEAATRTWTGTTSGLWSLASNWSDGVVPVTGDDLVFPGGASNLSNTNDLTENTIFNSITLSGSGYTLSGNRIILGGGLAGLTDSVASGGNTIALDIRVDATRWFTVTNSTETLTITGRIEGVGGLTKEGLGTLVLSGANTYGGTTKINVGAINARHNTALGSIALGTEVVGNAALELQNGISISYEPLTLRGYGQSNNGALRNISGSNSFDGLITIAGIAEIQSDSGTLTLNGGVTGTIPLIIDGAGNVTFAKTPIATSSGTITKNGAGTLTYNFPNTYTGLTTINAGTLLYGTDNAILSGAITVTGGTLDIATYSDMVGTVTLGTLDLTSGTITGSTGLLSSGTWTVYSGTISAIIGGNAGALTKSTPGTVTLTRPNKYTGATTVSSGILKIQDSMALGAIDGITTVSAGATLEIDGNGLSVPEYITFSGTGHLYTGAIRNRTGNNTITGLLTLGTAPMIMSDSGTTLTIDSKGLSVATVALIVGGAGDTIFTSTAPIYGTSSNLTKNDTGTLTIQSFSNFSGNIVINRGTVVLSGTGAIPLAGVSINSGGTLTIDNSTTTILNRISDSLTFSMRGGNFNYIGNSTNPSSEILGALSISEGHNIITVTPGAGGDTILNFASLTRAAGSTVLFRGINLGSAPSANVSTILFTSTPTLTGAAGSANSKTISVIKGAFGDSSLSGTGSDMVTYNVGNTNGLRLLNGAGFAGEYSTDLQTANANVKLNADATAVATNTNSLILNGFGITNPGGAITIPIASASLAGNILINSATNITGANTTLGITTYELPILATANSTISATIGTATTGSLTLSGTGNVTISSANSFTGLTSVNGATLTYGASNVLSSGGVTVVGGTLNLGENSDTVGAVILQNGTITGGAGVLSGTSYSLREGTVSAIINGAGSVVTRIVTNAPDNGVVTLTRENTYTGATTITSGILKLGSAGNGTNSPLGTIAGATTVANIAALDLNGFTLSTAEPLSLAGIGFGPNGSSIANGNSNMGALMNSSSTPVSYSGAITLTAAARINADYGALTISSDISGNFALTFGGFSDITYSGVRSGTSTIVKDGMGTLTLSNGNSSYTGATTISTGTVKIGAVSVGGTNSPLGTIAGATAITAGARLDLNGFSLGIAEPITNLNGDGYGIGHFASGALINSSATPVSWTGTITMGAASTIKASSGAITLSAVTGAFALTLGGSGNIAIDGVFGAGAATLTKIDSGIVTLSAVNTYTGATTIYQGTIKFGISDAAGGGPLGTAAGATTIFSGGVLDLNGFSSSTLVEALTINGFGIGNGGAMVNNTGSATYLGTRALGSDTRTMSGGTLLTLSGIQSGVFESRYGGAGNITISAAIAATASSLVKDGAGTLNLTAANGHTGATIVNAGTISAGINNALSSGTLVVNGGVYDIQTFTDTVGAVTMTGGSINGSSGVLTATGYTLESGTVGAILAGAVAVTKNTNNTVTLTGVNTISSTTTINAGTLTISGSGSAVSTTITVNLGGTLTLDNTSTAVASRLGDALALTMNGGNFNFIGNSAGTSSETTGALTLSTGHNTVTVTPGTGGSTTMTFASLSRTAGATVLFRGTSLGTAPAANISTLVFTATPTLTGGGGASNSTTVSIIKGAFGDTSLSGTGSDMVTYQGGTGLRLLNGAGFSGEYAEDFATPEANVKLTHDTNPTDKNTNSLILNGYSVGDPAGAITLPVASASLAGNILINSADDIAGANTTLGITTFELSILATANSTISATIGTATSGLLTLSGTGNVTLSAQNPYTGYTYINGATLTYGTSNVISSGNVTVIGGILNLSNNSDTVGLVNLTAGIINTGSGTLTLGGQLTTLANANFASIISGNLGLGANRDINVLDGLMDNDAIISAVISGAFTLTKILNSGVLVLSGNNTYTGLTTISAGTIRLGAAGNGTNTPLGTVDAGTTVSGASSALDLNGYTLGTAEALTLSGALANGALQNTSSTAVSYSGLITLGANSTIIANYGDINITNGGNITGTFNLTIGGAGSGTLYSNLNTSTGTLTKNGLGVWTIYGGASTFTGLTTISVGTLKLGSAGSGSNTPLGTSAGGVTVTSGAIFDLNGFTLATAEPIGSLSGTGIASIGALINSSNNSISYSGAITLAAASRVVNYGSGVFTLTGAIGGNQPLTFVTIGGITQSSASVRSGTSTIIKEGSGTLILAGQNTFTGAVTVSTGVLQLGDNGGATNTPLGTNAGGVTVSAGAVLDLATYSLGGASTYETLNLSGTGIGNGGVLISSASGNNNFGAMTVAANSLVVNSGSGIITFGGTITIAASINLSIGGTGPITIAGAFGASATTATLSKWDAGTLSMGTVVSPTTGLVRINGGTIKYGVADSFATPALTVAGGTLDLNGFNETNIGAVTLIDGSIVNTGGAATLTSTVAFTLEKGTISAVLGSAVAAGVAKNTGGKAILSGDNTFTSTSIAINAGTLNLQHNNALGASGTSLTTTVSAGATMELENNITLPATKAITINGTGIGNGGAIRNISGSNTISANVVLGTTNVRINSDSGTLTFPTMSGNTFNSIFGGAGATVVSGIISTTSGNLTKDGSGTLTLSGVNTYTRPTTILAGTIIANSTSSLGDGSATNTLIFNGGTLQATGTITSPSNRVVTLAYGGGTIDTNGNSVSIAGTVGSVGGLTKTGAGTLTITGVTTIGGNLTISTGTFVAPTSLTISGDFNNSGTFTHNNGTVTFVPTNATLVSNVSGSSNTTFYNFTNTTIDSAIAFKAGNTFTFENLLTLTGTPTNRISINSDTPGVQWLMVLTGSSSVNFINVKDSGCAGGNNIPTNATIFDNGNNDECWFFVSYSGGSAGNLESSATPDPDQGGGGVGGGNGNEGEGSGEDQGGGGVGGGGGGLE